MSAELELMGALVEVREVCHRCKRRVLEVSPSGGLAPDDAPILYHEADGIDATCPRGRVRGDAFLTTERVDELLGTTEDHPS